MRGEYFLNKTKISHGGIGSRYCYYMVIHWCCSGIYLAIPWRDDERR
jgi:hypothetical protein